jgi:hypothetical protein
LCMLQFEIFCCRLFSFFIGVWCIRNLCLRELSFIYNFTAECWYNQSRKQCGCFECRRFCWCENSWGVHKVWTWGESFQLFLVVIHVYASVNVYLILQYTSLLTWYSENVHSFICMNRIFLPMHEWKQKNSLSS